MPSSDKKSDDMQPMGFAREGNEPMPSKGDGIMEVMKVREDGFVVGPNGEKRPADPTSSAVFAMEVALGLRDEEYVTEEDLKKLTE